MKRKATPIQRSNSRKENVRLEDIPNVGTAVTDDLRSPGEFPATVNELRHRHC